VPVGRADGRFDQLRRFDLKGKSLVPGLWGDHWAVGPPLHLQWRRHLQRRGPERIVR